MTAVFAPLLAAIEASAAQGRQARFWLRDDDAVAPGAALDRLLALGARYGVPLTLAVIPRDSGADLADRLQDCAVDVAVHGWSHQNHAGPGQKSCELGADRPAEVVLGELARGLARLRQFHGARAQPVLVPPWNRIDRQLIPALDALGFRALSVFGPEPAVPATGASLRHLNVHVDLIDWRGHRGGRDAAALVADLVHRLSVAAQSGGHVGFMTHHLVHDDAAWQFTEQLFAITAGRHDCRWLALPDLLQPYRIVA